jgi:hypothetical protein
MLVWPAVSFSTRPVHPFFLLGGKVPTTWVLSSASHSALRLPTCTQTRLRTRPLHRDWIKNGGTYLLLGSALLLVAVGAVLLRRRGGRRRGGGRSVASEQKLPVAAANADAGEAPTHQSCLRLAAQEDAAGRREHVLYRVLHLSSSLGLAFWLLSSRLCAGAAAVRRDKYLCCFGTGWLVVCGRQSVHVGVSAAARCKGPPPNDTPSTVTNTGTV